jgi:hypothetical protein
VVPFLDYDKDGDADLIIGSGGNEIAMNKTNFILRAYTNDGNGNFSIAPSAAPRVLGNFSTMAADDIDRDGDVDIFLGARNVPGNYGLPPRSYLLLNDNGAWKDVAPPALANIGMVTDASWTDIDSDGEKDLVVVGDWMAISILRIRMECLSKVPFPIVTDGGTELRLQIWTAMVTRISFWAIGD